VITIQPLGDGQVHEAASLFVAQFAALRREVPLLSPELEDPMLPAAKLRRFVGSALAAVENGRLVGYLAWLLSDHFRGAPRAGAYVPEWAHGAVPGRQAEVYRALYRAAATEWRAAGCEAHAISLLAHDEEAREAWFWNGFGLAVVDAVRPALPLADERGSSLTIRQATAGDAELLAELDAEHVQHYAAPPVLMPLPSADAAGAFREFLARPKNSIWLALDGDVAAGFMRFSGYDFDAVAILQSERAAFCNGAFIRPRYRGHRAGVGMLQAALRHYARLGMDALYTNFESFNPEAASFWPRYFRPVCFSLMRMPEVR
jgi:GNAT superfamily N-acetyltransferase